MFKIGKSIGLKDMHPMQVKALLDLIGVTLNLAAKTKEAISFMGEIVGLAKSG